jgi:hypothetical protein
MTHRLFLQRELWGLHSLVALLSFWNESNPWWGWGCNPLIHKWSESNQTITPAARDELTLSTCGFQRVQETILTHEAQIPTASKKESSVVIHAPIPSLPFGSVRPQWPNALKKRVQRVLLMGRKGMMNCMFENSYFKYFTKIVNCLMWWFCDRLLQELRDTRASKGDLTQTQKAQVLQKSPKQLHSMPEAMSIKSWFYPFPS